jgi:hypothetical protein
VELSTMQAAHFQISRLDTGPHGFDAPRTYLNGPFVPHVKSRDPCSFTKVSDGPHAYTLNILRLQKKGALMRMSA